MMQALTLYCFCMRCAVMSAVKRRLAAWVRASTSTPVVHQSSLCSICMQQAHIGDNPCTATCTDVMVSACSAAGSMSQGCPKGPCRMHAWPEN